MAAKHRSNRRPMAADTSPPQAPPPKPGPASASSLPAAAQPPAAPAAQPPAAPAAPAPQPIEASRARLLLVGIWCLAMTPLLTARVQATMGLWLPWCVAGGLTALGVWAAARRSKTRAGSASLTLFLRRPHVIQIFVQGSVYAYWGFYAEAVYPQIPLILGQALLGMLIDVGIGWWRHGGARLSFGAWPIVGSINLFLWFDDPFFAWQFVVLAGAYASRELLRWRRDGQVVHVFNPSALTLTVAALAVIALGAVHHTSAPEISSTLGLGPLAFEQVFLAAVVGQFFFGVTLIPMAAALTMVGLDQLYFSLTGGWFFLDAAIPIAVFLSMNLLITDPITAPRTPLGKVLFGALYGVGVMLLYLWLRAIEVPPTDTDPGLEASFFDKLLHVPLLNLLVIGLDWLGRRLPLERLWGVRPKRGDRPARAGLSGFPLRALHVALWGLAFWFIRPQLVQYPGSSSSFWRQACVAKSAPDACDNLLRVLSGPCSQGDRPTCHDLALFYASDLGGTPDLALAEGLWGRNCEQGFGLSCVNLGESLLARGGDADLARRAFGRACDVGIAGGCTRMGILGVQRARSADERNAGIERLAQGCRGGDGLGCDLWGGELLNGMPPEPKAGIDLFERACKSGHLPGCVHQAELLRHGFGAPRDPVRAAQVLEPACLAGEAEGCAILGELYDRGEGVPADLQQAARFHGLACKGGVARSCRAP